MPAMAGIFINYRRDDSPGVAGRLFDYLALKYSRHGIFMDVDAMKPGMDFAEQLDAQVSQCRVLLAVIGPRWFDARDQAGRRRLDSNRDYVRIELASALKRSIPVIPILVDGAAMPDEDSLSDDLRPLARRHALELRHTRFNSDADTIMRALEGVVPRRRFRWAAAAATMLVIAGVAAGGAVWVEFHRSCCSTPSPPAAVASTTAPGPNPPAALAPSVPSQQAALPPPAPPSAAPAPQPNALAAPGTAVATASSGAMVNIDLFGSDYRNIVLSADDPALCQSACSADSECAAWSLVHPGIQGPNARCWLKNRIPQSTASACCVSGIERQAPVPPLPTDTAAPAGSGPAPGINLFGADFRNIVLRVDNWALCQNACRADPQCLAWTTVHPGIQGPNARCWLKNRIPPPTANACCTSGLERAAAGQ
jgi:hypothetical protein